MDFELSEEQKMVKQAIRDFAEAEIAPLVDEAEEKEAFPKELFPKMCKLGYWWPSGPTEVGGSGLDTVCDCIMKEETARICAGIAIGLGPSGGVRILAAHANEQQKQDHLIPALKGEKVISFGLTEPEAGSDALAMQTTAIKDGDYYILNGSKIFITSGSISDAIVVLVYTDKSKKARGVSAFIVDKNTPGFTASPLVKFAIRSSDTAQLFFEDCRVPAENLIGEEGRGFTYSMQGVDVGRLHYAAMAVGVAQAAYEAAVKYAKERSTWERPIGTRQSIGFTLARMATLINSARLSVYYAAWARDEKTIKKGIRTTMEASMAYLFAAEVVYEVTSGAMQIHGGYGLMMDSPVQRYFRDARAFGILAGTKEIRQIIIDRALGFETL